MTDRQNPQDNPAASAPHRDGLWAKSILMLDDPQGPRLLTLDGDVVRSKALLEVTGPRDSHAADATADALCDPALGVRELLIVVGSSRTLTATLTMSQAAQQDAATLGYMLEEHLPLDAEQIAADFIISKDHVFGIAVDAGALKPLVDTLHEHAISVRGILPASILGLAGFLDRKQTARRLIIHQQGQTCEILLVQGGSILSWQVHSEQAFRPILAAKLLSMSGVSEMIAVNVEDRTRHVVSQLSFVEVRDLRLDLESEIASRGTDVLNERMSPPVDLRRGALAPPRPWQHLHRHLQLLGGSAALFLMVSIATMCYRSHRYARIAETQNSAIQSMFRELFPDEPRLPRSVERRLVSETESLRLQRGEDSKIRQAGSALLPLFDVLQSADQIPPALRFRLDTIDIDSQSVTIQGDVKRLGDSAPLAREMRKRGYAVEIPVDSKSFRIEARMGESESSQ